MANKIFKIGNNILRLNLCMADQKASLVFKPPTAQVTARVIKVEKSEP